MALRREAMTLRTEERRGVNNVDKTGDEMSKTAITEAFGEVGGDVVEKGRAVGGRKI